MDPMKPANTPINASGKNSIIEPGCPSRPVKGNSFGMENQGAAATASQLNAPVTVPPNTPTTMTVIRIKPWERIPLHLNFNIRATMNNAIRARIRNFGVWMENVHWIAIRGHKADGCHNRADDNRREKFSDLTHYPA